MGSFFWVPETSHARFPVSVKSLQFVSAFGRKSVGLRPISKGAFHPQGVSPSQKDRKERLITGKSERAGVSLRSKRRKG